MFKLSANPICAFMSFRKVSGLGDFLPKASHSYNVDDVYKRRTMLNTMSQSLFILSQ